MINVVNDDIVVHKRQGDTYVNGREVTEPIKLKHGDRVAFGRLNVFRLSLLGQDDDGEGDWDAAVAELAAHASSTSGLDLPWDDDASSPTRSRQPSLESLDSAVSGRSRPSSCELARRREPRGRSRKSLPTTTMPWATPARVIGGRGAAPGSVSRAARCGDDGRKAPRPVITSPVARVSPPKVFSPLEAEVAELRSSASTVIEGRRRRRAALPAATAAACSPPARRAPRRRLPPRTGCGASPPRREGSRTQRCCTSARQGREGRSCPAVHAAVGGGRRLPVRRMICASYRLEYHNKKSRSSRPSWRATALRGAHGLWKRRWTCRPPRPPLATATATLDPHAAAGRAARRAPQARPAAAASAGSGRRLGAGPRALRRGTTRRCGASERRAR